MKFDYLELGASIYGHKTVIIPREFHYNYALFFPLENTLEENAEYEIKDWCTSFEVPVDLMSDGSTDLRNETARKITEKLETPQTFTLPCFHWINRTVELLG